MSVEVFANEASTTLSASTTSSATTLTVTSATTFPALTAGRFFMVRLEPAVPDGTREFVKVTAVSGSTWTVLRGQDGTAATAWANGAKVTGVVTAAALNRVLKQEDTGALAAPLPPSITVGGAAPVAPAVGALWVDTSSGTGADFLVLGAADPVPAGTPAGTIVIRSSSTTAVSPPSAVVLTASPGNNQITLTYTGGAGATSLALYRGTTATGTPIATSMPFTDTGRTNGTPVSYVLTATNNGGIVTSNTATATPAAPSVRPQVVDSTLTSVVSQGANTLTLTKPAGVIDGDLLVAVINHQNGPTPADGTVVPPVPSGWVILANNQTPQEMRGSLIAALPVPTASAIASTADWTFDPNWGTGRMVGAMFRVTGANLTVPAIATSPAGGAGTGNFTVPAYSLDQADGLTLVQAMGYFGSPNVAVPMSLTGATKFKELVSTGIDDTAVNRTTMVLGTATPDDAGTTMSQPALTVTDPPGSSAVQRALQAVTLRSANRPAPPGAIQLIATPANGQVTLSLTGGARATSYALYRGTTATGTPIATGFPFVDTGRPNGTPVSYIATATSSGGTVTSAVVTATPVAPGSVVTAVSLVASVQLANGGGGTVRTITVPAGVTTSHLGFLVTADANSYSGGATYTPDGGWTKLTENNAVFNNSAVGMWKKIGLKAGDVISITPATTASFTAYAVWLDTGGNDVAVIGTPGGRAGASSAATVIPAVTTTVNGQIVLALASERTTAVGAVTGTTPSMTQTYWQEDGGGTGTSFYIGRFVQSVAGTTGAVTVTYAVASGNGGGLLLALP